MTLRAFSPDTLPAELRFCHPAIAAGTGDGADPLAACETLAGTGIERMTPAAAIALLTGMGLCHTVRDRVEYAVDPGAGSAEVWCDPPPGTIRMLRDGLDGQVVVTVTDSTPQQHSPRPQPRSAGAADRPTVATAAPPGYPPGDDAAMSRSRR